MEFLDSEDQALLQERIGVEERLHVRFAAHWFEQFAGGIDFETWILPLPRPLTPLELRGSPLARAARLESGMSAPFVDELERRTPASASS